MTQPANRALGLVRISNLTDSTSSPERQTTDVTRECDQQGLELVGTAVDLDVSASKVRLFDRPKLAAWLDRPHDFDVIVFQAADRIVRSMSDASRLIDLAIDHDIRIVSVRRGEYDLTTTRGRQTFIMDAGYAESESESTSERTSETFRYIWQQGGYRGGVPPFGYIVEADRDPQGRPIVWRYVVDEHGTAPLVRSIVDRIIGGERPTTICRDMNTRGVPTPNDAYRLAQGKEPTGARWATANLTQQLRSQTLLGQVLTRQVVGNKRGRKDYGHREVVRGEDGAPIQRADPVISHQKWEQLQQALDGMKGKSSPYTRTTALLLRVIFCDVCGLPMYRNRGGKADTFYYRCSSFTAGKSCGNRGIRIEDADELLTEALMAEVGGYERVRKVYVPGTDTSEELAEVNAQLDSLTDALTLPMYREGRQRDRTLAKIAALDTRRAELEATEHQPAGYRYEPTGETFRQHWDSLDTHGKNLFLRDNAVRMTYRRTAGQAPHWHTELGDLPKLIDAISPGSGDAVRAELDAGTYRIAPYLDDQQ